MPTIQHCINNTFNSSIGETPFYALFSYDSSSSSFTPPKLSYAEDELTQHMKRIAQIRQHCRNQLLKAQTYYTDYTNNKRKPKNIKIGMRVYAKIDKHRQLPKNKLDLPISGPLKVISQKGKAWNLQELSTNKNYLVHPDYIVLGPSVVINEKPKITPSQEESSDDNNDPVTISHGKQIIHVNPHSSDENQPIYDNTEPKTNPEPPQKRMQPPRACKQS